MGDSSYSINNLLGKIFLTKSTFFGLDKNKIVILVTPSMKIAAIASDPKRLIKKFPFEERRILNTESLKDWAEMNEFEINFSATIPEMKKKLLLKFGDVMVESHDIEPQKSITKIVMEELEKSNLPQNIKEWAKQNPEKFVRNLEEVKKLLSRKKRGQ